MNNDVKSVENRLMTLEFFSFQLVLCRVAALKSGPVHRP